MRHSRRTCLLRRPESNRQSSGYEPDGIPLPYPAVGFDYTTSPFKDKWKNMVKISYIEKFFEHLPIQIYDPLCLMLIQSKIGSFMSYLIPYSMCFPRLI